MQLSEVFRIGIVVPLTEDTKRQLDNGNIDNCVEAKLLAFTQSEFYLIWETGFFKEVNESLRKKISEYEDEKIDFSNLPLEILQTYIRMYSNDDLISTALCKIYDILLYASEMKKPAYFIF